MDLKNLITFVVSVNNEEVFKNNFLASPLVQGDHGHQILAQRNFHSTSEAYNEGIDQTETDLIIFTHQDVFFPEFWLKDLKKALSYLEKVDPAWGVLGSYGVKRQ